jgi:hypothetical protein
MTPKDLAPLGSKNDLKDGATGATAKREYIPPSLETLGTIDDLTNGPGMQGSNDNEHPPGQNKSTI